MQIILSILLYLNVISSPGTYYTSQLSKDISANQTKYNAVANNSTLLKTVVSTYKSAVSGITVLDDGQLR
jgi:hypothetical protein